MQTTRTHSSQQLSRPRGKSRHGTINWLGDAGLLLAIVGYITLAYYTFAVVGEKTATEPAAVDFGGSSHSPLVVDEASWPTPEKLHAKHRATASP